MWAFILLQILKLHRQLTVTAHIKWSANFSARKWGRFWWNGAPVFAIQWSLPVLQSNVVSVLVCFLWYYSICDEAEPEYYIVFSERDRFLEVLWYEKQTYKMRNWTLNIRVPNILALNFIKSNKIRHLLTFLSWEN